MRDLEIRGARKYASEKFSTGHMEQVGYETYCNLLDEVMKEMKGIEILEEQEIFIDLNASAFIPDKFIEDSKQKIEIYQNIALCTNEDELLDIVDEIIDRYGKMPIETENLIIVAGIKNLSRKLNIIKIMQRKENVVFYFDLAKFDFEIPGKLAEKFGNKIKFSTGKEPYVTYKLDDEKTVLSETKKFLKEMEELIHDNK